MALNLSKCDHRSLVIGEITCEVKRVEEIAIFDKRFWCKLALVEEENAALTF